MLPPLEKTALEALVADAKEVNAVREKLQRFLAKAVGVVAVIYGLFTLNAYYVVLGSVVLLLFRYLDRRDAELIPRTKEASTNTDDNSPTCDSTANGPLAS